MAYIFNPLLRIGLDITGDGGGGSVSPENFSYFYITEGSVVNIPDNQEMLNASDLVIDGTLELDGNISQEVDYSLWAFGWNKIKDTLTLRVKNDRDLLFSSTLTIDGTLALDGRLIEVD
jgi:hypothetical protein